MVKVADYTLLEEFSEKGKALAFSKGIKASRQFRSVRTLNRYGKFYTAVR